MNLKKSNQRKQRLLRVLRLHHKPEELSVSRVVGGKLLQEISKYYNKSKSLHQVKPERNIQIFVDTFLTDGLCVYEIGEKYDLSGTRISQYADKALKILYRSIYKRHLKI